MLSLHVATKLKKYLYAGVQLPWRAQIPSATFFGRKLAKPRVERKLRLGTALWHHGTNFLKAGYSPQQISGTLALVRPTTPSFQVSHETIYALPRGELHTEAIGWVRFGYAKRRPRARGEDRRGKISDGVNIHERPSEVEERLVSGHWEGDLIKGRITDLRPASW